uniref:putative bifunctional diguanylate cyclase/phosphodiesterase n=1 Tax=Parerythrobacter lutipelagi TaxID=1964208 RepID=UPI0010F7CF1E|nr:EAL domain-containing protein [Parerythrobacter lutipelagi]
MSKSNERLSHVRRRVERDIVAFGIAIAAILMFIGTGGSVLPQIMRSWLYNERGPDYLLVNALLLNIALIVFGMRRYRELLAEIEQRRQSEETAKQLAEIDPLTGCLNRRSIAPATEALIEAHKDGHGAVAFLMIDLDNFKQVNDLNGHKVGDLLLQVTAERMRSILPDGSLLSRLGGDEFACVLPFDDRSPDAIDRIADKLISTISQRHDIDGLPVETTISVGIATTATFKGQNDCGRTLSESLLHRADIAMYHAKKQGKNRHYWFETSMETELRFRNEMEAELRKGILNGEFVPYYEQQIDIESGEIVGFEMLARWHSPELGVVDPNTFIPVAEEIGLIGHLSEQLIDKALEDAKEWPQHLTLSVNISPVQMRDPWFAQKLLKQLIEHNFPPERLEIEITESCLHENMSHVRSMIASLKNQGVRISLDDFGTGYSSLAQLRSLPFDRLKIDRSFVGELNAEDANEKLINAIIALGDGLNLPITAEGIEDNKILQALRGKGKLKGQGYLYGRPEQADAVRARLLQLGLLSQSGGVRDMAGEGGDSAEDEAAEAADQQRQA